VDLNWIPNIANLGLFGFLGLYWPFRLEFKDYFAGPSSTQVKVYVSPLAIKNKMLFLGVYGVYMKS